MSTTYHTLETGDIQSLQPGTLVQLDGELGIFLEKDSDPSSRIASYSFVMNDGRVRRFKGTLGLMYRNLRRVS
jgi:hypothetical protein